jgi:hypothetical protein
MITRGATACQSLEWVLQATEGSALFVVWQDDAKELELVSKVSSSANKSIARLQTTEGSRLPLLVSEYPITSPGILLVAGGLSSVPIEERHWINFARIRLLRPDAAVVLVEPASEERALRRDYPDIFSIARACFYLNRPSYEDDYLWNTIASERLAHFAGSLPPVFTLGSIIVDHGVPQFKGSPVPNCPRCGKSLHKGATTLTFRLAPPATQTQPIEGWICACGERYIPGPIAREAHRKAFAG